MKNEFTVDWPLLKKWTNEGHYSGKRLGFFILWCFMLAASTALIAWFLVNRIYVIDIYFYALIALFSLYRAFFRDIMFAKKQYKLLVQTHGKESWVRTILFEDSEIINKEGRTEIRCVYSDISKIVEKGDGVILRLQAKTAIRLYKSKFTDGSWEACKQKILENNAKEIL